MKKIALIMALMLVLSTVFVFNGCEVAELSVNVKDVTNEAKEEESEEKKDKNDKNDKTDKKEDTTNKSDDKDADNKTNGQNVASDEEQKEIVDGFFGVNKDDKDAFNNRVQQAVNGNTSNKGGSTSSNKDSNVQDDKKVLTSDEYIIVFRSEVDGEVVPGKLARKGDKYSMTTEYEGKEMTIIIDSKNVYMVSLDEKAYIKITKQALSQYGDSDVLDMMGDDLFLFNEPVASTYKETVDGVEYDVTEYESGRKDYFIGKTLIKSVDDSGVTYFDSILAVAPDSLFTPPADFEGTDLSSMLSNMGA